MSEETSVSAKVEKPIESPFNKPSEPKNNPPSKTAPNKIRLWLVVVITVVVALASGSGSGLLTAWLVTRNIESGVNNTTSIINSEGDAIAEVSEKIGASVVSVLTEQVSTYSNYFYGSRDYTTQAAGTGVIISSDGYIITNKHVIPDNTTKVTVVLNDGTEYDNVEVVDRDPTNDIAFLKIADVKDLVAATIGQSSELKIGTKVIAVGNALGQFQNTVTAGIISGLDRSLTATDSTGAEAETLSGLLQTDAAINSGNSGGPLVTYDGKVIGINTAIASDADNIGFAIPSDAFVGSIDSVIEKGQIEKPYLGVYYTTITKALAKEKNLVVDNGALIGADNQQPTVAGSPAEKAGLKAGDIITKVDSTTLDEHNTLSVIIAKYQVGDEVKLTILRDGKESTVSIKLEIYKE
jgi:S1-C subfamily serine protease